MWFTMRLCTKESELLRCGQTNAMCLKPFSESVRLISYQGFQRTIQIAMIEVAPIVKVSRTPGDQAKVILGTEYFVQSPDAASV